MKVDRNHMIFLLVLIGVVCASGSTIEGMLGSNPSTWGPPLHKHKHRHHHSNHRHNHSHSHQNGNNHHGNSGSGSSGSGSSGSGQMAMIFIVGSLFLLVAIVL